MLGRLLEFVIGKSSNSKIDTGGGYNVSADHYSAPGDDASPLPGDHVAMVKTQQTGGYAAVGYIDTKNDQKTGPGGKRIYARDEDGNQVAEIWIKNNGDIDIGNDKAAIRLSSSGSISAVNENGSFALEVGGDFTVNGVTISTDGKISAPTIEADSSLKVATIEVLGHEHTSATPGSPTGPMQPGS